MATAAPASLAPRKRPRQARSAATLDAIFEATIQVLLADGTRALTTTRVAERAGVSVGTMYQYFPHKQSLIFALNERYLEVLAAKVEATCRAQIGKPVGEMLAALIATYWRAKTERAEVTRALYRSVVEMDNEALVEAFARRVDAATTAMLESAPDAAFANLPIANLTLVTVIFGTIRNAFERNLSEAAIEALQVELLAMCRAYVGLAQHSAPGQERHQCRHSRESAG
ncbi:TetR family transcriptional regulator [Devosia soli]|uniref:TetR family transcriptional regulator n=1 Tax=Devosia soli TaxID=361041 RepID=A0A0F5LEB0_9HYPH|nr:TetR/AcrR family transcriptional regulator [Devosia soli]KKB80524.1 TetR family transcriptional regulator [Devosia soli]